MLQVSLSKLLHPKKTLLLNQERCGKILTTSRKRPLWSLYHKGPLVHNLIFVSEITQRCRLNSFDVLDLFEFLIGRVEKRY